MEGAQQACVRSCVRVRVRVRLRAVCWCGGLGVQLILPVSEDDLADCGWMTFG